MLPAFLICVFVVYNTFVTPATAFVPFLDGGKDIPTLYKCYFDSQIAKQASAAVSRAVAAGKTKIEINFPPVPNLDEVRFGTPLNQKFGQTVVAPELKLPGGYVPGSDIARQQVAFANIFWAKRIASAVGGFGRSISVFSAEPVTYNQIKDKGGISKMAPLSISRLSQEQQPSTNGACIVINPGGEETWERIRSICVKGDRNPFVVLNNAYSTTYGLGNKRGYEEAYYLKRISKGWIFRSFPGPWLAYLEKPNGKVELLKSYTVKPELNAVATLVREESFKRYAINNDRWSPGFGERL
jgi:Domain of unknown function (DUF1995)